MYKAYAERHTDLATSENHTGVKRKEDSTNHLARLLTTHKATIIDTISKLFVIRLEQTINYY